MYDVIDLFTKDRLVDFWQFVNDAAVLFVYLFLLFQKLSKTQYY